MPAARPGKDGDRARGSQDRRDSQRRVALRARGRDSPPPPTPVVCRFRTREHRCNSYITTTWPPRSRWRQRRPLPPVPTTSLAMGSSRCPTWSQRWVDGPSACPTLPRPRPRRWFRGCRSCRPRLSGTRRADLARHGHQQGEVRAGLEPEVHLRRNPGGARRRLLVCSLSSDGQKLQGRIYRAKIGPNFWTGCSSRPNSAILKCPDQQKR
jgi:hypothetical protein